MPQQEPHKDVSSRDTHQRSFNTTPPKSNSPQEKKRTTAIALSVITCLFMCVIGYEIIRVDEHVEKANTRGPENNKPDIASFSAATDSSYSHAFDDPEEHEQSHYELKILREQNRSQLAKIKALKQEILTRMQEIHDVKANLFKQEGDPKDKARLVELDQKLKEKEENNSKISEKLSVLEDELTTTQKKLAQAELTNEALATLIERNRLLKEKEVAGLNQDIDDLKAAVENEKISSSKKIIQYQDTHDRLLSVNEEKSQGLFFLESELKRFEHEIDERNTKLSELVSIQKEEDLYWKNLAANLSAAHELETLRSHQLDLHLKELYRRHDQTISDKAHLVNALEDQILYHRNELEKNRAELDSMHDFYTLSQEDMREQLRKLAFSHELESLRTLHLKKELGHSQINERSTKFAANTARIQYEEVQKQLNAIKDELQGKEIALTTDQLALIKSLEALKTELETKEKAFEKSQIELTQSLESMHNRTHFSENEAAALRLALEAEVDESKKLREELRNLAHTLQSEQLRYQTDLAKLNNLNQYLTIALEEASARHKDLTANHEDNQLKIDGLSLELSRLEAELQTQTAVAELEINELEKKLKNDLDDHAVKTHQTVAEFEQKEEHYQKQLAQHAEALDAEKQHSEALKKGIRDLEDKVLSLQYEVSREYNERVLAKETEHFTEQHQDDNHWQAALEQQKVESLKLLEQLHLLQAEKDELKERLEHYESRYSANEQEAAPQAETAYEMINPADYFNPRRHN